MGSVMSGGGWVGWDGLDYVTCTAVGFGCRRGVLSVKQ